MMPRAIPSGISITMPEWSEDALVLSVRPHGESSAVVSVLTAAQGRHAGLVRGGNSSRLRGVLQPGNRVRADWRQPVRFSMEVFRNARRSRLSTAPRRRFSI